MPKGQKTNKNAISKRYRKVSWGRLYWKHRNSSLTIFESGDVAVVRNGTLTIHYKTVNALLSDISKHEL